MHQQVEVVKTLHQSSLGEHLQLLLEMELKEGRKIQGQADQDQHTHGILTRKV